MGRILGKDFWRIFCHSPCGLLAQENSSKNPRQNPHKLDTGTIANSNVPSFDCKHARLIFIGAPLPRPQEESAPNGQKKHHFFQGFGGKIRSAETGPFEKEGNSDKFWAHSQHKMASDQRKDSA